VRSNRPREDRIEVDREIIEAVVVVRDHQPVVGQVLDRDPLGVIGDERTVWEPGLGDADRNIHGVQDVGDGLAGLVGGFWLHHPMPDEGRAHEAGRRRVIAGKADEASTLSNRRDIDRADLPAGHADRGRLR